MILKKISYMVAYLAYTTAVFASQAHDRLNYAIQIYGQEQSLFAGTEATNLDGPENINLPSQTQLHDLVKDFGIEKGWIDELLKTASILPKDLVRLSQKKDFRSAYLNVEHKITSFDGFALDLAQALNALATLANGIDRVAPLFPRLKLKINQLGNFIAFSVSIPQDPKESQDAYRELVESLRPSLRESDLCESLDRLDSFFNDDGFARVQRFLTALDWRNAMVKIMQSFGEGKRIKKLDNVLLDKWHPLISQTFTSKEISFFSDDDLRETFDAFWGKNGVWKDSAATYPQDSSIHDFFFFHSLLYLLHKVKGKIESNRKIIMINQFIAIGERRISSIDERLSLQKELHYLKKR